MSVQLILYPQHYDGFYNYLSFSANPNYLVNFSAPASGGNQYGTTAANPMLDAITNAPPLIINTMYAYSTTGSPWGNVAYPQNAGGGVYFSGYLVSPEFHTGVYQQMSGLVVGGSYTVALETPSILIGAGVGTLKIEIYSGTTLVAEDINYLVNSATDVFITFDFTCTDTNQIVLLDWYSGYSGTGQSLQVNLMKVIATGTGNTGIYNDLQDGQVICDLYEDEDIPLTLSVDDFKNVAEKVQSYSKAFNLPATKRNNQIFDSIYEVTRTDTGLSFNPYVKTQCVLKQDGFMLFEGYLRLIDISDKEGEISYNVNLYSEVIALADTLKDKTFSDLDFKELQHEYQKENIKRSWNDSGDSITYTNGNASGFRDDYTTLRYPFVDWSHQIAVGGSTGTSATVGNPELLTLEAAFRPFINIKYLIDRIFQATTFTYESAFFDTDDFKKLYMDFNWGLGAELKQGQARFFPSDTSNPSTTSYTNLRAYEHTPSFPASDLGYDETTGILTALADDSVYTVGYNFVLDRDITGIADFKWVHKGPAGNTITTLDLWTNVSYTSSSSSGMAYDGQFTIMLDSNETLQPQFRTNITAGLEQNNFYSNVIFSLNFEQITTNTLLQTFRGELGQWDFLKGLTTMFNLVSIPDKDNPNNILLEPYGNVFIHNTSSGTINDLTLAKRGIAHDWTDKIDISEMKLIPLTDLNKKTIFKFVEDEDDYSFNQYKHLVGGHLYGSKKQDEVFYTVLTGEDEIVAEPFAATIIKPLMAQFPSFITPAIYSSGSDGVWEGFENSPRIMYNNGIKDTGASYYIPAQNGLSEENQTDFLQFSHLSDVPTITDARDFHFGICQVMPGVGNPVPGNLFSLYWQPYYNELYNPDTRIMTLKVNLSPSDISTFKMYDTVMFKNREFRVNKIDYKPNDLAKVEFILVP